MKKKILQLEQKARILDEGDHHHNELMKSATEYGDRFLQSLSKQKAYEIFDESVDSLLEDPLEETPGNIREIIQDIENRVIPPGLNPASGNHYGYIPGGGLAAGAAGDYLAAITNPYAGVYFSSPGAVNLERRLIRWMAEFIGYSTGFGGNLTSGGSIANLTAVHTAREAHNIKPEGVRKAVVYVTDQTHHCVERALLVSGMGECVRQNVPMDDWFRMDPSKLQKMVDEDRKNGLNPWMVVASAGTTDAGAVDPLEDIAAVTSSNKLWFHVDAAYGGFFLLTERGKEMMKGIEKSDSVVLDPHKGMFISYG
ncbi:MAG: pyridoxal-dependent decarboxylase, partial [Balneolaceae bacterium]